MNDQRLLGSRVPAPEHFETAVGAVLFDKADPPEKALAAEEQASFLVRLSRLLSRAAPRGLMEIVPLLRRIDREVLPACGGPARREALSMICSRAPHALSAMPQASAQAHSLSRALFLSGVLHPQALQRIEQAVRAEGIEVGGGGRG